MHRIRFLVPANIQHNSGGNVYNARLVQGLSALGAEVEVLPVQGSWPKATAAERRRLGSLLGEWAPGAAPGLAVSLVDGLIAVGAPDELEFAAGAGHETWALVHMPAPEATPEAVQREARALRAASGVICTSASSAATLAARHNVRGLHVALPGTEPATVAQGSSPPHILTVAALLPHKDQLLVLAALAQLKDVEWTASLVGSDRADPAYARMVRAAVAEQGLEDRVELTGELVGQALETAWNRADLTVLVSRIEAFGMVVTESLAHGIPVVVRAGTGAVEALSLAAPGDAGSLELPGMAVAFPAEGDPANPALLAGVLRRWLKDSETRAAWKGSALHTRDRLPGWEQTGQQVLTALAAHDPDPGYKNAGNPPPGHPDSGHPHPGRSLP